MRFASINTNKKLESEKSRQSFMNWVDKNEVEYLFVQEATRHEVDLSTLLPSLHHLGGNSLTSVWSRNRYENGAIKIVSDRFMYIELDGLKIGNLYFYSNSGESKKRTELLSLVTSEFRESDSGLLLLGDFNISPSPADGMFGDAESDWTTPRERLAFRTLLDSCHLVDLLSASHISRQEFTIEQKSINNKQTRFRCDLALLSEQRVAGSTASYDHTTRQGEHRFTDHSGILVDI